MSDTPAAPAANAAPPRADAAGPQPSRWITALREIASSSWLVSVLSVVIALIVGAILIAAAHTDVQTSASYLFARPGDFFGAVWSSVSSAYVELFKGGVLNVSGDSFVSVIKPLTETLTQSTPLIFAGLGLAIGFQAGLFNIGAQGQILLGAAFGAYVGFAWHMPAIIHIPLAVIGAIIGGGLWGFIPGILKAKTGANEVIVTIMLNSVAGYLVAYLLTLKAFRRPGSNIPQAPVVDETASFPRILGPNFSTNLAFIIAILAAVFTWWLMQRSTLGFRLRAVGANPAAARTAGMNVNTAYVWVMVIAGAMAGLAGASQVLSATRTLSLTDGIAATFGFDAITVALLGRSKPLGTFLAGLLFGALRAGGYAMQVRASTPIDVILVLQSVIVLLIAAPPLVRAIFRLPDPDRVRTKKRSRRTAGEGAAA
jgi:simple sugar transport system permease protein